MAVGSRVVLIVSLALAGCSQSDRPARAPVQSPRDIVGIDLEGAPMRLSDYRGKVVLVDFWRTGCPPCTMFHATERALLEKFGTERFAVVGVNLDADPRVALRAAQREGITWRSFNGGNGDASIAWGVEATPTVFLLDPQGVVRYESVGAAPREVLEERIEKLLKEK